MKKLFLIVVLVLLPVCSLADVIFEDGVFSEYETITYKPYDFSEAYHNSLRYKGTMVVFEGLASTSYNVDAETSILYVNTSRTEDKSVLLIVNAGPDFLKRFSVADTVLVKGMAMGDSTELGMSYKSPIVSPVFIEIVKPGPLSPNYSPDIETVGYAKKGVNVRSFPDSSEEKVGYLKQGEKVYIVKPNFVKGWHQILYNGSVCYVSSKYIKAD